MKQSIKNFGKILLVLLVIFNLLYLFRINYSVGYLKNSFKETQSLTNELQLLKGDLIPDETTSTQDSTLAQTILSKLDQYKLNQSSENSLQELQEFLSSSRSLELPEGYTVSNVFVNSFDVLDTSNSTDLLEVAYDPLSQILSLRSFQIQENYNLYQFSEFQEQFQFLISQDSLSKESKLSRNFQAFSGLTATLESDQRFSNLQEKGLELIPPFHKNQIAYIDFLKDGEYMLSISQKLDSQEIQVKNQQNQVLINSSDQTEISEYIFTYSEDADFKTLIEQNIQAKVDYIKQTLEDPSLQSALKSNNYIIGEPLNTNLRYEISILNEDQNVVLSIQIDKTTAQANILFQDETTNIDFKDLSFDLPEIEKDTENHLILGRHGSLTDTIIIANFDNLNKEVKLISLPRDLYIENKKINSLYVYRSLEALVTEVESITGLSIDKYALVDMYTFIDVVDTLGGIEVELDKPLVDPSYTTFDNDQWGTLNLSAGTHTVNGRQALRIARSRYSTSDFDRAHRQHLILDGLKDRVRELGAKDAKTITELALLGIESTETNLSFTEVLSYYRQYKDYQLKDSVVLSTSNVLQSTYTGALSSSNPDSTEEAQNRGAYILLPKNNDWFLIRTFVYRFLSK